MCGIYEDICIMWIKNAMHSSMFTCCFQISEIYTLILKITNFLTLCYRQQMVFIAVVF